MLGSSRVGFYKNKPDVKRVAPLPDTFVVGASSTSPYIHAYEWRGPSGFGPKYSNPASIVNIGHGRECAVSPDSTVAVVGGDNTPYIAAYQIDPVTGFGNTYSNPATLPNGQCYALAFNRAGNAIAYGQVPTGSPTNAKSLIVYRWNNTTGFGTLYTTSAFLPSSSTVTDVDFARDDSAIVMTSGASPYVRGIAWDNTTGFGTVKAGPATVPSNQTYKIRFNNANNVVGVCSIVSPYVFMYAWSASGFGTKFADSATLSAGANAIDFTLNDDALIIGQNSSPYISSYRWNNSTGFGVRWANPTTIPSHATENLKVSPDGKQVVLASNNGGLGGYKLDTSTNDASHKALAYAFTNPASIGFVNDVDFGKKI